MIRSQPCAFLCCNQAFESGEGGIATLNVTMPKSWSGSGPEKVRPRIPFLKRSLSCLIILLSLIFSELWLVINMQALRQTFILYFPQVQLPSYTSSFPLLIPSAHSTQCISRAGVSSQLCCHLLHKHQRGWEKKSLKPSEEEHLIQLCKGYVTRFSVFFF